MHIHPFTHPTLIHLPHHHLKPCQHSPNECCNYLSSISNGSSLKLRKGIFIVESLHGFVVTPDGQDPFTLRLQTPQVRSLGDQLKFEFKVQPNWYYNDTRYAQFNSIVFDKENWEKPQQVDVFY
jgi:hypothetical protein